MARKRKPADVRGTISRTLDTLETSIADAHYFRCRDRAEALEKEKANLANWFEAAVRERTKEILERAPDALGMTPHEREYMAAYVRSGLDHLPNATWTDILWCLAVDGMRPGKRGTPPKWSRYDGRHLWIQVEGTLWLEGKQRGDRKAIRNIIHHIRDLDPERYGELEEQTLRDAYYQICARLKKLGGLPDQGPPAEQRSRDAYRRARPLMAANARALMAFRTAFRSSQSGIAAE
jgi:hypothetical protein